MSGSWVPGADGSGFGIENLPYGVIAPHGAHPRAAVRIGDYGLDLAALAGAGLLDLAPETFEQPTLNRFLGLGPQAWSATRDRLRELLAREGGERSRVEPHLLALQRAEPVLPVAVGDYVDFFSSLHHATNAGRILRLGAEPLRPNWRHLPVGYHGRSATVVISGTPIDRPVGQRPPAAPGEQPSFGPERQLDFELELGFLTGGGPPQGTPIPIADTGEYIFGFVLVNDWSAREIQRWESAPLGPFLGKSFATSVSPWIVPLQALEQARVSGPVQEPAPLEHLRTDVPWGLDIELQAALAPPGSANETTITRTNARELYWNAAQQLAHATSGGASVAAGDLFASGTISGAERGSYGCLLELSWGGRDSIELSGGERRTFLDDGDTVVLRGRAGSVSLGEVRGQVIPARPV